MAPPTGIEPIFRSQEGDDVSTSDNDASFSIGYADLEISDTREERIENGRNIIISIQNTGLEQSTTNRIKLNRESANGELIESFEVEMADIKKAVLKVTIHEGRNRQVRRMCAMVGMEVTRLIRIQEGSLNLGDLPSGKWRYLTDGEVKELQK